jgi:hypothetical protein
MKKPLLALLLLPILAAAAPAQTTTAGGARSDEITLKIKKLDVLIQVVPLALRKEQFGPILASIEKMRQKDKELRAQEDKDLANLDAAISKAVDEAIGKEKYPPRETQTLVANTYRAMGVRRQLFAVDAVDTVFAACKATLNEGQIKTMEKSLKPDALEPGIKVDEMDSDAKVKFFIRKVLLDPVAYDVLVQMSKQRATAEGG